MQDGWTCILTDQLLLKNCKHKYFQIDRVIWIGVEDFIEHSIYQRLDWDGAFLNERQGFCEQIASQLKTNKYYFLRKPIQV